MEQKEFTPILRRLYVFWLPERIRKYVGEDKFLYLPNPKWGQFTSCQPMWVIKCAKDCKLGTMPNGRWPIGLKAYVHDGFELENCSLDLWEKYKNEPEFMDLKWESEQCGCLPQTAIISEGSIIGVEEIRDTERKTKKGKIWQQ